MIAPTTRPLRTPRSERQMDVSAKGQKEKRGELNAVFDGLHRPGGGRAQRPHQSMPARRMVEPSAEAENFAEIPAHSSLPPGRAAGARSAAMARARRRIKLARRAEPLLADRVTGLAATPTTFAIAITRCREVSRSGRHRTLCLIPGDGPRGNSGRSRASR